MQSKSLYSCLRYCLCFFLFSVGTPSFGVEPNVIFKRLGENDGLTTKTVLTLFQDSYGFIWIGGEMGLTRYDGFSEKRYLHDNNDEYSLSENTVIDIVEDHQGYLWVSTTNGLNRFDQRTERFNRYNGFDGPPGSQNSNYISKILIEDKNTMWLGLASGGIAKFDPNSGTRAYFEYSSKRSSKRRDQIVNAFARIPEGKVIVATSIGLWTVNEQDQLLYEFVHPITKQPITDESIGSLLIVGDKLWIGTASDVLSLDLKTWQITRYIDPIFRPERKGEYIALLKDKEGFIWAGSFGGGLKKIDPKEGSVSHFNHEVSNIQSLSDIFVYDLIQDTQDNIWIGTYTGGVNLLNPSSVKFNHYRNQPGNPHSLITDKVCGFSMDSNGDLWVGTSNGLSRYNHETRKFSHFRSTPDNSKAIPPGSVCEMIKDSKGNMWFATNSGLLSFNMTTESFSLFSHDNNDEQSLSDNRIRTITEAKDGNLWVGTLHGLNLFDPITKKVKRYNHDPNDNNTILSEIIKGVFEDSKGLIWSGGAGGLSSLNPSTGEVVRFTHDPNDPNSLSHDYVFSINEDHRGRLLMATKNGLDIWDRNTKTFKNIGREEGLPDNVIYGTLVDDSGQIWMSTNEGLVKLDPNSNNITIYTKEDGLQSDEFNAHALYRSDSGELFFGGHNGFNRFQPDQLSQKEYESKLILTEMRVSNRAVTVVDKGQQAKKEVYSLSSSIFTSDSIQLTHKENIVSFEFSSLNFRNPKNSRFAYRLDGLDNEWIETDHKNRLATFTHLPAGDYTLRIKSRDGSSDWSESWPGLKISVLPPPWKSWWAYTFYFMVLLGIIAAFVREQQNKVRRQIKINEQLQKVDKLKDEFLANTSHELRTPLNGIIGLTESLLDGAGGQLPDKAKKDLVMVISSGKRLTNLVNDILDFSKLKNHNLMLNIKPVDLCSTVDVVFALTEPLLSKKPLTLHNDIKESLPAVAADEDRLFQILHNLVGNAIKFTDKGDISVSADASDNEVTFHIKDTGIGIAKADQELIFESFEQIEDLNTRSKSGSGLGLAICKKLIELHRGKIKLTSEPEKGSTFSVTLPVSEETISTDTNTRADLSRLHSLEGDEEHQVQPTTNRNPETFKILIVDDEPVNRQVLFNHLALQNYQLIEASNGPEALDAIEQYGPFDLVLLDIMMPKMSGYEVCQQLRSKHPLQELPVIFLTAKNQVADLLESFSVGANDYLSKPVSKAELLARVKTHLDLLDVNRNLEQKVEERTSELNQEKEIANEALEKVATLLNSAGEGFLSFAENFQIESEYSKACLPLLNRKEIAGLDIRDVLYPFESSDRLSFIQGAELMLETDDEVKRSFVVDLLPQKISLANKSIELGYSRQGNKIVLRLTDVTDKEWLQNILEKEQHTRDKIVYALKHKTDVKAVCRQFEELQLDKWFSTHTAPISSETVRDLFRRLHTFKGQFLQMHFMTLGNKLHKLETALSKYLYEPHNESRADLEKSLQQLAFSKTMKEEKQPLLDTIDKHFFDQDAELTITSQERQQILSLLTNPASEEAIENAYHIVANLHKISIEQWLSKHASAAESLASGLQKQVKVVIEPHEALKLDPQVYTDFMQSLLHVFCNAVIHGFPDMNSRQKNIITCKVSSNGQLSISIADNGQGIDLDKIKEQLIVSGELDSQSIGEISNDKLVQQVFTLGLSTHSEVTIDAGRGVGLADVKEQLNKLNGSCEIRTEKGVGTTFIFTIPLN